MRRLVGGQRHRVEGRPGDLAGGGEGLGTADEQHATLLEHGD